jgi:hypothetical protein
MMICLDVLVPNPTTPSIAFSTLAIPALKMRIKPSKIREQKMSGIITKFKISTL